MKKFLSLAISLLLIPLAASALSMTDIPGSGQTGGTSIYPFPSASLVNSGGTIYFISGTYAIPFTNFAAFKGLGYSLANVVDGDVSIYQAPQSYAISTAGDVHPWGSWLSYKGTIYYSHESGLIGVPNMDVFTSNGGDLKYVVPANSYDLAVLNQNPNLEPLDVSDSRVYTQPVNVAYGGQQSQNSGDQNSNSLNKDNSGQNTGNSGSVTATSTVTILNTTLPAATVGVQYMTAIGISNPSGVQLYASPSNLPPGLGLVNNDPTVSGSNVFISGTPVMAGSFTFNLSLVDADSNTLGNANITLVVNPAANQTSNGNATTSSASNSTSTSTYSSSLSISPSSLPNGQVGQPYSIGIVVTSYQSNSIAITVNGLPPGLTAALNSQHLNFQNGVNISGTPIQAGTYAVAVSANDGTTAQKIYTLVINP